jgi:hypothetical protein
MRSFSLSILALAWCTVASATPPTAPVKSLQRIGVAYVFHGGSAEAGGRSSFEATLQIFAYDPNSAVYRRVIWDEARWPQILGAGNAPKELGKYAFSYARIGGRDESDDLSLATYEGMKAALEAKEEELGVDFIVDYVSWLATDPAHHAYPRLIYEPRVPKGARMRYCGGPGDPGVGSHGRWPGCDPDRYDVDGTIERLLAQDVEEIYLIDLTTSGVRFFKSWDVVNLARQVVHVHNARHGTKVAVRWVNDPTDLMTQSYPVAPARWTASLGEPKQDASVALEGRPNPVSASRELAMLQAEGILAMFAPRIAARDTGVLLVNHATRDANQWFDPKVDDTLVLNRHIAEALRAKSPGLREDMVVGAWFGRREVNPAIVPKPPTYSQLERTREMRGENLGDAWLYESDRFPEGEQRYLYWDALAELKARGAKHIVVAFPQIMVDSVLNLVEVPNQIGKEIGWRGSQWTADPDFARYPGVGHPFADYWGIWVDTRCPARDGQGEEPCCFVMGGCGDDRVYPPPRLAPKDQSRDDLDPSLAYDVSAFGHVGYDPSKGAPDDGAPVQEQYRGSWTMWRPPNDDPRVALMLAELVVEAWKELRGRPASPAVPLHCLADGVHTRETP